MGGAALPGRVGQARCGWREQGGQSAAAASKMGPTKKLVISSNGDFSVSSCFGASVDVVSG
jgi:hypothetical protein